MSNKKNVWPAAADLLPVILSSMLLSYVFFTVVLARDDSMIYVTWNQQIFTKKKDMECDYPRFFFMIPFSFVIYVFPFVLLIFFVLTYAVGFLSDIGSTESVG